MTKIENLKLLIVILTLLAFWLLLSGIYTPFLVASGITSAVAIVFLVHRMDIIDHESFPLLIFWPVLLSYFPWLVKEIITSGYQVAKLVLHPKLPISPSLKRFCPMQKTPVGLVTHANSITLTPGTISVLVEPDMLLVHAITETGAQNLPGSEMDRRCAALERVIG